MTDNEIRDGWNFSKMVAINIGSVTLSKEDVLAIDDLMNRQKAEIERLQTATDEAVGCFHRMESLYHIKCMELKVAKAEAVKEFAEQVIDLIYEADDVNPVTEWKIDNLVKEFTEETK